jgi:histidine triad (HIT) family protein
MAECVFCKIVAGEIPCTKVFEDGLCLAFLDIGPISPGHTLLVPKAHYETIHHMPADEAAHLARHIPALAAAVQKAVRAEGINVLQNNGACSGQEVFHVHVHLIPRWPEDGLGFRWPAKQADPEVLKQQAEAITKHLKS